MRCLEPSPSAVHIGFLDAGLSSVMEVHSGETVRIRSISGASDDSVPKEWEQQGLAAIEAVADRGPGTHVLTGPIGVRGAKPGMVLQVDILGVDIVADYGYNRTRPMRGLLSEDFQVLRKRIIPIDRRRGVAHLTDEIRVPVDPFFGVIAVAPPSHLGRVDSGVPGPYGGNMDNKELRPGARLFLPIWKEGALLSIGDGHAAQGDGEVNVSAIETSLEGRFRVSLRQDLTKLLPFAMTEGHLITMGFHESLNEAAKVAVRHMVDLLSEHYGILKYDAYALCSIAANLRVTQVVNGIKGIHVMLDRSILHTLDEDPPLWR